MYSEEITPNGREIALEWMNCRIRNVMKNDQAGLPEDWLPQTGVMVKDENDRPLLAAFLYLEKSSPVAVAGWVIANPENTRRMSYNAAIIALSALKGYARKHKAKYLMSTFGNRGVNDILKRLGFVHGEYSENKFIIL